MRSLHTAAICLTLIHLSVAYVPHSFRDLIQRDAEPEPEPETHNRVIGWFVSLFKRQATTTSSSVSNSTNSTNPATSSNSRNDTCYQDLYWNFVNGSGPHFCQQYMQYPNVTLTVDFTPASTETTTYTRVSTDTELSRFTPESTVTVTVTPNGAQFKRDAHPEITPGALSQKQIDKYFRLFRRQNSMTGSATSDVASMSSAFSSACSCQDYAGSTVTETYTDATLISTLSAFDRSTTTVRTTTTAAVRVVTRTVTAQSSSSTPSESSSSTTTSTSSSSSSNPTPTAPPFTCPEDNNTTVSQMVGNERFDYTVLCDTILRDPNVYNGSLSYSSFGQCVAACSVANANFSFPVCQGISYFTSAGNNSAGNCFLKSSANSPTAAPGVDSALLVRIALGVTNTSVAGTTTESAPFADETMTKNPQEVGSSMDAVLSDSSLSMPIITPVHNVPSGMLVNAPGVSYSTHISDGSTFSSGTAYSFATTFSNGSWYSTYYTSFTVAWATATEVYASSSTGSSLFNSSNSQTQQQSAADGGYSAITTTNTTTYYPGGFNVTEVISNQTFAANGSEIYSTATTYTFQYQTGGAASGTGVAGASATGNSTGGSSGGAAGGPASGSAITSSTVMSKQTVILNSGGTGGAMSGFGSGGVVVSTSATTIVNSYATAYSSGFAASGVISSNGTGGAGSGFGSGGPTGTPTGPITVIVNSSGTGFAASGGSSGGPTGIGGANSTEASGGPSGSFSNTNRPRSGTYSGSTTESESPSGSPPIPTFNTTGGVYPSGTGPSPTGPLSTGPSPYPSSNETTSSLPTATGLTGYPGPSPSTDSFSNTNRPRSGTYSGSTTETTPAPSGTGPSGYGPPSNETMTTGTAPPSNSTSYSSSSAPRSGTYSTTSMTGTAPPLSTYPGTISLPTTCANMTLGTTTIFSTTTVYGCYSSCAPSWGGYGGPQSFGPPVWASGSSSAETTSTAR